MNPREPWLLEMVLTQINFFGLRLPRRRASDSFVLCSQEGALSYGDGITPMERAGPYKDHA